MQKMSTSKPYLLRALYEWILDNECTPHIMLNALHPEVEVPWEYVQNDMIILNVSPTAVHEFVLSNESLSCHGRFGGIAKEIYAPIEAIMGIFARESGQGMEFDLRYQPAEEADPSADAESSVRSAQPEDAVAQSRRDREPPFGPGSAAARRTARASQTGQTRSKPSAPSAKGRLAAVRGDRDNPKPHLVTAADAAAAPSPPRPTKRAPRKKSDKRPHLTLIKGGA